MLQFKSFDDMCVYIRNKYGIEKFSTQQGITRMTSHHGYHMLRMSQDAPYNDQVIGEWYKELRYTMKSPPGGGDINPYTPGNMRLLVAGHINEPIYGYAKFSDGTCVWFGPLKFTGRITGVDEPLYGKDKNGVDRRIYQFVFTVAQN